MTATFFANARLIDPVALTDGPGALLIEDGIIIAVGDNLTAPKNANVIDCGGHCLAPGIIDIGVKVSEPGERHKE
jgi:dihydroorotase